MTGFFRIEALPPGEWSFKNIIAMSERHPVNYLILSKPAHPIAEKCGEL
jgi:hypothetical protein